MDDQDRIEILPRRDVIHSRHGTGEGPTEDHDLFPTLVGSPIPSATNFGQ